MLVRGLKRLAREPVATAHELRARHDPQAVYARQAELARRAGIDSVKLVLSFDCDTDEDARVAWKVHSRLTDMGVRPVYAVPGELLERGADVYRRIAATGAEFMNHGYTEHTFFNDEVGAHTSCFFYDELPLATVRRDIEEGDRAVRAVLGTSPRGFRAPHFGTFQRPRQLRFLHGVLRELDYAYSSSTVPLWGLRHGPVFNRLGIVELPTSGFPSAPLEIIDTWSCFAAPDRVRTPADYRREGAELAEAMSRAGAGVINVYGDPLHIHDRDEFFDTVELWSKVAEAVSYRELLEQLRRGASAR